MVRLAVVIVAAAFAAATGCGQTAPDTGALMKTVRALEGQPAAGRRQAVIARLHAMGLRPLRLPFTVGDTVQGENLVVRLGDSGKARIVVGAHYDAVPGSPGANDNAGGVAVVLELLRSLKDFPWRHQVDFCLFDREEDGLLGSREYVLQEETPAEFLGMLNLDVVGTGTEIYVGPVGGGDDERIMTYVRAARDSLRFLYREDSSYPGSDHLSFASAGLENISLSVVPEGDAAKLSRWARSGFARFTDTAQIPAVLKVMHSPRDSSAYVTPRALRMAYEFARLTLLLLDRTEE